MANLDKTKFLQGKSNFTKLGFSGSINSNDVVISTINPLYLSFIATTDSGDPLEFTIYGEANGDLVIGFGFAELEVNQDSLSPLYLLSRFSVIGSATTDQISLVGTGDLRSLYQLAGTVNFNIYLTANNSIIDEEVSNINGFIQYEDPDTTLAPTTLKRLPNALYNKNSIDTNINKLLRAYDKEILRAKSRIKMIQTDAVVDLARHISLINNFSHFTSGISSREFDPEEYRRLLKKVNDILLLEDNEDMVKEVIRFFTDAEPEIIDLNNYKIQLGSTQLGENSYAVDRDLFAFTMKVFVKNPMRKKLNKKALITFLQFFIPSHIKFILQFEDGEIINF